MTVAIPLVEEAAAGGAAAGEGAAATEGTSTLGGKSVTERTGITPKRPASPRQSPRPAQSGRKGQGSSNQSGGKGGKGGKSRGFPKGKITGGKGTAAHKLVIAEFILCVILIGLTPIIMRQPGENGHLYVPNDFIRLTAVCLLFFVLALLSNSPRSSRFAAAFGGLVTLGVLFNANQAILAIGNIFTNANAHGGAVLTAEAGTKTL